MGLQTTDDLAHESTILAGPFHPAFGHLVYSRIFLERAMALLEKQRPLSGPVTLKVHPRSISRMRGNNNRNVTELKKKFDIEFIRIKPDPELSLDAIVFAEVRR